MNEARDVDKLHTCDEYRCRNFSAPKEEVDKIYLTDIGAFTGQRFSDFSRLKDQNISDTITLKKQKTGTKVAVPIHWVVREILDRGYDFGKTMSNQKLNEMLKTQDFFFPEKVGFWFCIRSCK